MCVYTVGIFEWFLCTCSCWSDHLQPDLGKQDSHHFECHLVSQLPQVLLLHCVPLHPRWLHQCHPTCKQWHLPHSDLPPTRHHLQDWGGGCEEGRRSRRTEGKGHGELLYSWWMWGIVYMQCIQPVTHVFRQCFLLQWAKWLQERPLQAYHLCMCLMPVLIIQ